VEAKAFEQDIEFLLRNNYRPLSLEEFSKARVSNRKSVLLTFDDARRSFYEVAFPILRKYEVNAALFVPTYWVGKEIESTRQRFGFMSWNELREVAESELVDVQSHGHRHQLVYTSDKLVAFAAPGLIEKFDIFDWPTYRSKGCDQLGIPPLGTPIYRAAPILSCKQRFIEDQRISERCQEFALANGGTALFATSGWRGKLRSIVTEGYAAKTHELTDARAIQIEEFEAPFRLFREHLGYTPSYLAYPWMLGNRHTLELAKDHGIRTVFGVGFDFGRYKQYSELRVLGRYKSDWLRLLPGEGRESLFKVLGQKLLGGGTGHLAH